MKVLAIPEDPMLDQYILKPVLEKILEHAGKTGQVDILHNPRLKGIDQALDRETVARIMDVNRMADAFVIVVGRDCDRFRNTDRLNGILALFPGKLFGCLAIEELETWMLALFDELPASWPTIRGSCDPKEEFAEPLLRDRGWATQVGRGRKRAMRELAGNLQRLFGRCPEIRELRDKLAALPAG